MSIREFCKTYCGNNVLKYKQATIDIMEHIEETLNNDELGYFSTRVGACHYTVSCALEVYNKELPDYDFLQIVEKEIKHLSAK